MDGMPSGPTLAMVCAAMIRARTAQRFVTGGATTAGPRRPGGPPRYPRRSWADPFPAPGWGSRPPAGAAALDFLVGGADLERGHLHLGLGEEGADEPFDVGGRDQRLVALDVHVHV